MSANVLNVTAFPDRKAEVLRKKFDAIVHGMSAQDADTLQNDRVGVFLFPVMPSILMEHFNEWNGDYGRGETGLSHENIHETYATFYEHIVDSPNDWDKQQVEVAHTMLQMGRVGPHASVKDETSKSTRPKP